MFGDDNVTMAARSTVDRFKAKLEEKHELKEVAHFGRGDGISNRIVKWLR